MKPKRLKAIPESVKAELRERSGGYCEIRLRGICMHVADDPHHKKKRSAQGSHSAKNIVMACRRCHDAVENNEPGTEKWRTARHQKEGRSLADG